MPRLYALESRVEDANVVAWGPERTRNFAVHQAAQDAVDDAEALGLQYPLNLDVLLLRAECALNNDEPKRAVVLLEQATGLKDRSDIWLAKGRALMACDLPNMAALSFDRANALTHLSGVALIEMLAAQLAAGRPADVLKTVREMSSEVIDADTAVICAQAACDCDKPSAAKRWIDRAVQLDPEHAGLLRFLEHFTRVHSGYQVPAEVLRADTRLSAQALASAARLSENDATEQFMARLRSSLQESALTASELASLHHAQFTLFNRLGQTKEAFGHLMAAHEAALAARHSPWPSEGVLAESAKTKAYNLKQLPKTKHHILPVFVVGLPGSGVTAATRLIGQAAGTMASRSSTFVLRTLREATKNLDITERPDVFPREVLVQIAASLRLGMAEMAGSNDVFIQASQVLTPWVGLICAALPEARVIHMRRDRMQTGWAMLSMDPVRQDALCTGDATEIAALQGADAAMATQWGQQFPSQVCDVSGDALCRPSGATAHALLQAIGLNWTERCVQPAYVPSREWHRYASPLADLRNIVHANAAQ